MDHPQSQLPQLHMRRRILCIIYGKWIQINWALLKRRAIETRGQIIALFLQKADGRRNKLLEEILLPWYDDNNLLVKLNKVTSTVNDKGRNEIIQRIIHLRHIRNQPCNEMIDTWLDLMQAIIDM